MSSGLLSAFLPLPVSPGFVFFPLSLPAVALSLLFLVFGPSVFPCCGKPKAVSGTTRSCKTHVSIYVTNLLHLSGCDDVSSLFSSPPFCDEICPSSLSAAEA